MSWFHQRYIGLIVIVLIAVLLAYVLVHFDPELARRLRAVLVAPE